MLLRDFISGVMLAGARRKRQKLRQRVLPLRGVSRAVLLYQARDQVGPLEHHAAASRAGRGLAEIAQERRVVHGLVQARTIVNRLLGELDDRTGLDVSVRADVVADA